MDAGDLYQKVAFDEPVTQSDGQGGTINGWSERFQRRAHYLWLRGGETVQAARLEGRQPLVITVRSDSGTRQITTDWRARDARSGAIFNIRGIVPSDNRAFLEITVESGVAV